MTKNKAEQIQPMIKPLCCNIDAEKAVLSACILQPNVFGKVANLLTESDFVNTKNRIIFVAMSRLAAKEYGIDPITVKAEIRMMGKLDTQDGVTACDLLNLWDNTFAITNWREHALLVHEARIRRKVERLAIWIDGSCAEKIDCDLDAILLTAENSMSDLRAELAKSKNWGKSISESFSCSNCNTKLPEGAKYCPTCGNKQ